MTTQNTPTSSKPATPAKGAKTGKPGTASKASQGNGKGGTSPTDQKTAQTGDLGASQASSGAGQEAAPAAKVKKTRVYVVKGPKGSALVRAHNKVKALLFIAKESFTAEVANSEEMFDAGARGEKMHDATAVELNEEE